MSCLITEAALEMLGFKMYNVDGEYEEMEIENYSGCTGIGADSLLGPNLKILLGVQDENKENLPPTPKKAKKEKESKTVSATFTPSAETAVSVNPLSDISDRAILYNVGAEHNYVTSSVKTSAQKEQLESSERKILSSKSNVEPRAKLRPHSGCKTQLCFSSESLKAKTTRNVNEDRLPSVPELMSDSKSNTSNVKGKNYGRRYTNSFLERESKRLHIEQKNYEDYLNRKKDRKLLKNFRC